MIKTKATDVGKVGGNHPAGAPIGDTTRTRVGGTMPATAPLPTMADQQPWLTVGGASVPTPDSGPVAESLPLFSPTAGYIDTGAQSTGDLGGAA